jgi:ABC-type transport system involved in multi-copper enzyme maturation permease subunit
MWPENWSWTRCAIVALLSLLVFVTLIVGLRAWSWLAGIFALAAFIALQIVVFRHGGWRLLGPHFYYDVVRLARRGRSTLLRCSYILALFAGLAFVFEQAPAKGNWRPNDFAAVSERFAFTLFFIQNLAVLILTPAYLASAIAEEKERRTLELLFTTQLSDTEIILGKFLSRIIHLFGFVIAGFPILSLIQIWGGIDMLLIAGNLVNTLLNILTIGSLCLSVSVRSRTVSEAVMASYAFLGPFSFCCVGMLSGFPFILQDARQGGERVVSVQDLGVLAIVHFAVTAICLALAVVNLREQELAEFGPIPPPQKPGPSDQEPAVTKPAKRRVSPDTFPVQDPLPAVTDNALLWKERYLGGTLPFLRPIIQVPALPVLMAGILALLFWFELALTFDNRGFRDYHQIIESFTAALRFFYYVFLACYVLGVAYRATGSVARERQQQTLEPLLLLPIGRGEILRAKWLGSLMRGWPWLALILADIVLGTLIGAYHPFSAVLLCLAPWPMIFFFASLGLFLSVVMTTVLRANLMLVLVAVLFIALFIACATSRIFAHGPFVYLEAFAFSLRSNGMQDGKERLILAALATVLYLLAAAGLWKLTVLLFEKRPPG